MPFFPPALEVLLEELLLEDVLFEELLIEDVLFEELLIVDVLFDEVLFEAPFTPPTAVELPVKC